MLRQLSARKYLPFTPVLAIRIIGALPLGRNYRISIAETRPVCKRGDCLVLTAQ